jgi:hypothetical protein
VGGLQHTYLENGHDDPLNTLNTFFYLLMKSCKKYVVQKSVKYMNGFCDSLFVTPLPMSSRETLECGTIYLNLNSSAMSQNGRMDIYVIIFPKE